MALAILISGCTGTPSRPATGPSTSGPAASSTTAATRLKCSPAYSGSSGDIVDQSSGEHFSRLKVLCIGDVGTAAHPQGTISGESLYVCITVGLPMSPEFRIARVDLSTYAVSESRVLPGDCGQPQVSFGAVWVEAGREAGSKGFSIVGLSPSDLGVLASFGIPAIDSFAPFGPDLWVATGGNLFSIDPITGTRIRVMLPSFGPSEQIAGIVSSPPFVFLTLTGTSEADNYVISYRPSSRLVTTVPGTEDSEVAAVTGDLVWISMSGGLHSGVYAVFVDSQRLPHDTPSCQGYNSAWGAMAGAGDMWCNQVGPPLTCISGASGATLASLRLPGSKLSGNVGLRSGPFALAAGGGRLVISASSDFMNGSGIAIYKLDPRCDAPTQSRAPKARSSEGVARPTSWRALRQRAQRERPQLCMEKYTRPSSETIRARPPTPKVHDGCRPTFLGPLSSS